MSFVLLLTAVMLIQVKKPFSHYFAVILIFGKLWVNRLIIRLRFGLF